ERGFRVFEICLFQRRIGFGRTLLHVGLTESRPARRAFLVELADFRQKIDRLVVLGPVDIVDSRFEFGLDLGDELFVGPRKIAGPLSLPDERTTMSSRISL